MARQRGGMYFDEARTRFQPSDVFLQPNQGPDTFTQRDQDNLKVSEAPAVVTRSSVAPRAPEGTAGRNTNLCLTTPPANVV